MGWHIPYEIVFEKEIDWDDDYVKAAFETRNISWMYLRGSIDQRLIVEIYTTNCDIQEALEILTNTYNSPMKYRLFKCTDGDWCHWT